MQQTLLKIICLNALLNVLQNKLNLAIKGNLIAIVVIINGS